MLGTQAQALLVYLEYNNLQNISN